MPSMFTGRVFRSARRTVLAVVTCGAAALGGAQPAAPAAEQASAVPPPLASQMASVRTFQPRSNDELAMLLSLKTELLTRVADPAEQVDAARAAELCTSTIADAERLYGRNDIQAVPALRAAARVYLRLRRAPLAVQLLSRAYEISKGAFGADDPAIRFVLAELAEARAQADNANGAKADRERAQYLGRLAAGVVDNSFTLGGDKPSDDPRAAYQVVPVFYQTTRVRTGAKDAHSFFGYVRGATSHYGISYVSVPRKREVGSMPSAAIYRLDIRVDPSRHVFLKEVVAFDNATDFWKSMKSRVDSSFRKEALIFVHGFNQSFRDGVETAATLATDLEIDGSVVAFSWPSRKNLLLYGADIDEAGAVLNRTALRDLLTDLSGKTGAQRVYVVAHSMGNKVLLEALGLMSAEKARPMENVVFASPDMESADFTTAVAKIGGLFSHMTLYTAGSDLALELSDMLRGIVSSRPNRAGNSGSGVKPTAQLDVVDASNARRDVMGHANFMNLAKDDLKASMWFGLSAEGRCVLVGKRSEGWRYEPSSPCTSDAFSLASSYLRRYPDGNEALSKLSNGRDDQTRSANTILREMLTARR